MKLLFRQRFISWFDSYDIYDEYGNTVFVVKGQLSWGHCLKIYDARGVHVGTLKERVITILPRFDMYAEGRKVGTIGKNLTLFRPRFSINCKGWQVRGSIMEWNYQIINRRGKHIAKISKELLHFTDTYAINIADPQNALYVLMMVIAIDVEKCTR